MAKTPRKRRGRRSRTVRRSTTSREIGNILSAMKEAEGHILALRAGYLGAIAEGLHNTLCLYWHYLASPPTPRGRQTTTPFKPGRSTIKRMLADFPVTLANRHSIARALFELSVQGPHAPNLKESITEIAHSLCLTYRPE